MRDDHLITSPHTLKHWPQELYLTDPVIDRENREAWEKAGAKDLNQRAIDSVERRLAAYEPIETDSTIDQAMRDIVTAGFESQEKLPDLPPPPEKRAPQAAAGRRGRARRRRSSS
jgi:trimethylamine:corrinoid methyltransferase-like protein